MVGSHELPTEILRTCNDGMLYCFAEWAYQVTDGMFWTFMLLGFVFALFIATSRLGSTKAFGYASFVGMLGSIWFAVMQLMPWWIASAFILTGVIGLVMMVLSENK